jgi:HAE1 family hydrophobic/amphiphilic exporter-1
MGKDHYTAAREGTDEIGLAVAATTFSILAVFVPIGFMPGLGGEWFKPFALTIACSVLVSLFVSFSLDPMLSAYWPDPHKEPHERAWVTRKLDAFNAWFNRQADGYRKVIGWALDHRKSMVTLALLAFFGALAMPAVGLVEGGFFPEDDRAEFTIMLETPPGSNLEFTRLKAEELGRITRAHPEVRYTYTTLGAEGAGTVDVGNIYVRLVPRHDREKSAEELAAELRREAARINGVTASVFTNGMGGGRKQLQFQLRGADMAALTRAAEQVMAEVKAVPGAVDVGLSTKGQKPELDVELHRGVAGSLGITVGQVAQSLRPAFAGIDAGDWEDPSGEQRDVVVRLAPEARRRAADLAQLPLVVSGPNGAPSTLPLGQVATIREGVGPAVIDHLDGEVVVTVEANVTGRGSGDVTNDIAARLSELQLPPGVRWSMGGESKDQAEVFGQIFTALGAAILLMYLILVVQFGSFLDPLAILVSLPLSLIGVMLALALTGNTLNIMSMIAIILLAGIVAKNAILLIDFAKWARERNGLPLREALIEAGAIRLRPIIMTTVALVAGMVPVAFGSGEGAQFRAPLGIAVIGGVITSTLLTLLVIPTFYEIMDGWRAWLSEKLGIRRAQFTAEHRTPLGRLSPEVGD